MKLRAVPSWRIVAPMLLLLALAVEGLPSAWASPIEGSGESQASADSDAEVNPDPYERYNRAMFRFNRAVDRAVLRPIARGYDRVTPEPVQKGISNFFDNLGAPVDVINSLLQGKFRDSAVGTGRFLVNSTVGVLGLFDPATGMGLERIDEDFGQTMAVWGAEDSPYLVLPLLGPSTVRDGIGRIGDGFMHPLYYVDDDEVFYTLLALDIVSIRAGLLPLDDTIERALDPYVFVRDAYLQRRRFLIYDGDPPMVDYYDDLYDVDALEDEPLPEPDSEPAP